MSIEVPEKIPGTKLLLTRSGKLGFSRDGLAVALEKLGGRRGFRSSLLKGRKDRLPAKPDEARRLNGDLRVAIVTRIQPPCFVTGRRHRTPTIKYLYDVTNYEMGFVGSPKSEWILYRASTKEVVKRGKFK